MIIVAQDYGTTIGKRSNCLYIENLKGTKEICVDKITEIHVYPSCKISSDAIQLCMQKDIWIMFVNNYGEPEGEIVPFSGGCSPIYKRKQLFLSHRKEGVEIAKQFLIQKIENRIQQLKKILHNKRKYDTVLFLSTSIKKMEEELEKIRACQSDDMDKVRESLQGYEGTAGRAYFECISYLLPDSLKFSQRTRNADDVYNCVLNYLYGIMYAKIKKITYKCRLDPYIGIMHVDSYNKPTFVFDFIEGQRIFCEEIAFEICSKQLITRDDMNDTDKGFRFTEQARQIIVSKFYDKLKEECYYKKKQVTIERKIYLEMLEIAQRIGDIKENVLDAV